MTPRILSFMACLLSLTSRVRAQDSSAPVLVEFNVQLDPSTEEQSSFKVEVYPSWAPVGAARFLELVDYSSPDTDTPFFDQMRFFRVIDDFIAQFGIAGDPNEAAHWREKVLQDDPVEGSNTKGTLTFAMRGPNTRTTQLFINLEDNARLDDSGFAPFAKVVEGMDLVEGLYGGYGEGAPDGNGPDQSRIQTEGNEYLAADFPLLSKIVSVKRIEAAEIDASEAVPADVETPDADATTPAAEDTTTVVIDEAEGESSSPAAEDTTTVVIDEAEGESSSGRSSKLVWGTGEAFLIGGAAMVANLLL